MQFYSLAFIAFMAVALAAYYLVGRLLAKGQWVVLLIASLVFYAFAGWENFVFIGVTAMTSWLAGLAFSRLEGQSRHGRKQAASRDEKKEIKRRYVRKKRLVLVALLLINFGILSYIKYAEALVRYLDPASGFATGLLLPLGISFYTFQSMSYVIDTYNAKYEPEGNFARFLLFVSFFPQLIQGPINRFDHLAAQLFARRAFDAREGRAAVLQIGYGAFKKFAIADILVSSVDTIFAHVDAGMPGSVIVLGILMYAVYQYADFSGGIDMVLGFARLFGIQMTPNFRQPYFSVSLGDFWRRWHITLGAWMRDYVFYPFALLPAVQRFGKWLTKRCGKHLGRTLPACIANIIVFFLVGLWHGAESHFILWGLYNGVVIAASDLLAPVWDRMNTALKIDVDGAGHRVFSIVRTFVVVNIGWYFDRIEDFADVITCFHNTVFEFAPQLFGPQMSILFGNDPQYGLLIALVASACVFAVSVLKERGVDVSGTILAWPVVARGALYAFAIIMIASSFMYATAGGFMYANF